MKQRISINMVRTNKWSSGLLLFQMCLLNIVSICGQKAEVNFVVFSQEVTESISIVSVQLRVHPVAYDTGWVSIIQEVSSTVDFSNDLNFNNPSIVAYSPGDSILSFSIGVIDDNIIEDDEQIMLAIESTSDNLVTGAEAEHVVRILDNDCNFRFENVPNTICIKASPIRLVGSVSSGSFFGPGISNNIIDPKTLKPGTIEISYTAKVNEYCVDTIVHNIQVLDCTLSLNTNLHDITVYPNPSRGYFKITIPEFNEDIHAKLLSAQGSFLRQIPIRGPHTFIASNLAPGLYFLELKQKSAVKTLRLMVQ